MKCQKCGSSSRVLNSRNSMDDVNKKYIPKRYSNIPGCFTYRDHKCNGCGACFQSIQVLSENLEEVETRIKREILNNLQNILTVGQRSGGGE